MQTSFDKILAGLFPQGGKVLLAVSGGVDSMVMLDLFLHTKLENISFEVAHCNFKLRDEDSFSDELFVANYCASNRVVFNRIDFDTEQFAREQSISIEMAARALRYDWFHDLAVSHKCDAVAVAHNANDNAETLLLNLLRGCGLKGLTAISADGFIPVKDASVRLVRPLLSFSREEIEQHSMQEGIMYSFDRTNAENEYNRNKIRNQVFPILSTINPSFISSLNADISRFEQVYDFVQTKLDEDISSLVSIKDEVSYIDIKALLDNKNSKFTLYNILDKYGFNETSINQLFSLINSSNYIGRTFLSASYRLSLSASHIIVFPVRRESEEKVYIKELNNQIIQIGNRRFSLSIKSRGELLSLKLPKHIVILDLEKLPLPLWVRRWKKGDYFVPLGLKGKKKLSDYFVDRKFNVIDKENVLVLAKSDDKHIIAILSERIDDNYKITDSSTKLLLIEELF